jgi:predicted transcriptional regulator
VTGERNGAPEYPAPRTVENVNDDLTSHSTMSASGQQWITAAELQKVRFPELQWAVPGLLPEGVALVAGAPKVGKSAWAMNLCVAVATGGKAFGAFDVDQGDALYLSLEDGGKRRVQERLARHLHDEPWPKRFHLATEMPRLDEDGAYDLAAKLETLPDTRLIVVDTLQRIRPQPTSNRNRSQYETDYDALETLTGLAAEHNVTIAVIHHTREMKADDWLDSVSGSRGLSAAVDTVLVAERGRGSADVVMRATGRDLPEAEYAFTIDFDSFTWAFIGDATRAQLTPERRAVIDTLDENGPSTPTEIANDAGLKLANVKHLVRRMANDGVIRNHGGGRYDAIRQPGKIKE